jgi:hypothetical protein
MEGRIRTGDIDNIYGGRFGGLLFCSGSLAMFASRSPKMRRGGIQFLRRISVGSGVRPFAIYHEMNDCRWYAADQKAKYDDDDPEIGPRISAPNPPQPRASPLAHPDF